MKSSIIKIGLFSLVQVMAMFCYGQQNTTISGVVRDQINKAEIPYAAVAISGTSTGTVTDIKGHFSPDLSKDTITISCIGYETKHIMASNMNPTENVFFLQRRAYSYNEVIVSPKTKREITAEMIEKMMAKISDTLYISKYETPLYLYKAFFEDICMSDQKTCEEAGFQYNNKYDDKYPENQFYSYQLQIKELNWTGPLVQLKKLNWTVPVGESLPVSDITYEGAQEFCLWLTKKYSEFKKRKYKNAVFRLPTSNEWTYAAQGGAKEKTRFPWRGDLPYYYPANDTAKHYYVRYMGSFDTTNGFFWGENQVFYGYANKFGLINVCGSVSEMVLEKGIYKGGCVLDKIENIGIYSPQDPDRKDPDFFIGFRVAMIRKQ